MLSFKRHFEKRSVFCFDQTIFHTKNLAQNSGINVESFDSLDFKSFRLQFLGCKARVRVQTFKSLDFLYSSKHQTLDSDGAQTQGGAFSLN
jgi:hypothetical protein